MKETCATNTPHKEHPKQRTFQVRNPHIMNASQEEHITQKTTRRKNRLRKDPAKIELHIKNIPRKKTLRRKNIPYI
jgi:hypothetical protein